MSNPKKLKKRIIARSDALKTERRENMLATARRIVLENGYAALSLRKLAAAIGCAPGTIYLYFKDRDELVREICYDGFRDLYEKMKPAASVADPEKRLAALLGAYADFAAQNPDTYRLSFMEDPQFTAEMFRAQPLDEVGAGWQSFALLVKALEDLKQAGKLSPETDENLLAEVLWTGVHGAISLKLIYPAFPMNSLETLIDKMIETLINGLQTK